MVKIKPGKYITQYFQKLVLLQLRIKTAKIRQNRPRLSSVVDAYPNLVEVEHYGPIRKPCVRLRISITVAIANSDHFIAPMKKQKHSTAMPISTS